MTNVIPLADAQHTALGKRISDLIRVLEGYNNLDEKQKANVAMMIVHAHEVASKHVNHPRIASLGILMGDSEAHARAKCNPSIINKILAFRFSRAEKQGN